MNHSARGFTIVEILVVIVITGILAAIGIAGFNTYTAWSRDRARENDIKQWSATFDTYRAKYTVYPDIPTADGTAPPQAIMRCLGAFASNKCVQFSDTSTARYIDTALSSSLNTEVAKVGSIPVNSGPAIEGKFDGPFVYVWKSTSGSTVTMNAKFVDFFENGCPGDFDPRITTQPSPAAPFTSLLSGVPSTVYVCSLTKSMTYSTDS